MEKPFLRSTQKASIIWGLVPTLDLSVVLAISLNIMLTDDDSQAYSADIIAR